MRPSWITAVLVVAVLKGSDGQSVNQSEGTVAFLEGHPILLQCSYQWSSSLDISPFWYVQRSGQPPKLFLKALGRDGSEEGALQGFDAKHDKTLKTFHLAKPTSQLSDSAVYFCAASVTNANRQSFGKGTLLKVIPNLEDSGPSLYKLKPQKGENENINACLITDYSPGSISAGLGDTLEQVNGSLVITDDGPSYGTVLWGSTNGNFKCVADYKGQKFNDTKDDDGTCRAEFETDERLNFLSLTVLGLRIIFLKTVAINLLLTFRLWSC